MDAMTEEQRLAALEHLRNPRMPDPMIAWDYGVLYRDLPPRRTLRQRVAVLAWWRRPRGGERPSEHG
jgi:hypothetical protein